MVNHELGPRIRARSAGLSPHPVHPKAIAVMRELGIDISRQRSKHLEEFKGERFDCVITLCAEANEACPVIEGATTRLHIGFDDPARATGKENEVMDVFRSVRDQIRERVLARLMEMLGI